ncbi:MAG: DDE-type integrase/transposase/recombinase [Betaproteobacteria bacterium]|nr:DDE-type integrase/transposase/recombinase [Betaproteobacteria bacterium]
MTTSGGGQMRNPPPKIALKKGSRIVQGDREYTILNVVSLRQVIAREHASGEKVILDIADIDAPYRGNDAATAPLPEIDIGSVSEDDWEKAQMRLDLIRPILEGKAGRDRESAAQIAKSAGIGTTTLYRWLNLYRDNGVLSALLPTHPSGGKGRSRLREEVRLIAAQVIDKKFLSLQKLSIAKAAEEIRRLCSNAGIEPLPAVSTVYRLVEKISGEEKLSKREGPKAAREKFAVHKGSIPGADWPLAIVQMDHTQLPVIIVDDARRLPTARPWITLAIDVNTRVVLGMFTALEEPSALSAGMCVSHAILPKEAWLERKGLRDVEWDFYGVMDVLHMDNAKEFKGKMLRLAAKEYDIDLHLRPVKQPHYGAHIERLMGTVSEELKTLQGTTFANPKQKGVYDAEGNAMMTFDELDEWLIHLFHRYHLRVHSQLGTSPLAKWKEGILGGKGGKPGRGLPERRTDVEKVRIDFMPFVERTIQDYGMVNDGVYYFHDILRPWVNSVDPDHPGTKRQFRFRYDPRDVSQYYFFDPETGRYYAIPYRDSSLPPVSLWELRDARRRAKADGLPTNNEREIFAIINKQRKIEDAAAEKTKSARRAQQKRKQQAKVRTARKQEMPIVSNPAPTSAPDVLRGYDPSKVEAIDDDE